MPNTDFKRYLRTLHSKDFIPTEIIYFLEQMYTLDVPSIKKKVAYTFDAEEHAQGKSLISRKDLYPYAHFTKAEERLTLLCQISFPKDMHTTDFVQALAKLQESCKDKKFTKRLLQAYMHEEEAFYQEQAERDATFSFVCYFISYMTFMPFFTHAQSTLKEQYDEKVWRHGHCPYCGAAPLLSYLKDKEGLRVHTCSQCLGSYRAPRIGCPICLEDKQKQLSYFTSDTDKDCQVCHCKKCNNYIKILDYREREGFNPLPLLDDLLTITLDIICEQQKFQKPTLSLWL